MSTHAAKHDYDGAPNHGSRKTYLIGFGLSVALTVIPFWLVMAGVIESRQIVAFLAMALAVVQIVVHMVYFLHMDTKSEGGWTFMALLFTAIVIVIALSGSLWVMFHLTTNMMPMSPQDMKQMP